MCTKVNKVVLVHATKVYGEVKEKVHILISWAVDGAKWSRSHTGCFTTGKLPQLLT